MTGVQTCALPIYSSLQQTKTGALLLAGSYNLILIGVVDKVSGETLHFVMDEKEHTLNSGDVLVVLGPASDIKAFKEEIEAITLH